MLSEEGPHLTPTLSFQERGPVEARSGHRPDFAAGSASDGFEKFEPRNIALLARIDTLLAEGARWVWFRERDMAPEPRAVLARAVLERTHARGAAFTLGGDAALAAHLGADGVHLPGGTPPAGIEEARRLLPDGLVGVSAHSVAEVAAAARYGADYATLSPIFATASKPGYGPALGPEAIAAACVHGLPVLALGGITPATASVCRAAGAAGIAVMGDLMRSPDPAPTLRALLSG